MADPEKYKAWLDSNSDKAGTPDYVKVSEAYAQAQDTPYSDVSGPTGAGMTPAMRDEQSATDPNSFGNIARRAVAGRLANIPDFGIALANLGSKYGVFPETKLPYISPMIVKAAGGLDMPADAPWWQRVGEGMLSMSPTAFIKSPVKTLASTAGAIGGAEGGAALGNAIGVDPELLSIVGGVTGGHARTLVPDAGRASTAALYRNSGKDNAGAIYDAAVRTGTTPTGAMLGNQAVQRLEQVLERQPGSGPTIVAAREQARNQFTNAARGVPEAAGATMREPTDIARATQATTGEALAGLEERNSSRQQQMQDQIGPNTPINVAAVDRTMSRLIDPTVSPLETGEHPSIQAKLDNLRAMYQPPDPTNPAVQGPPSPEVRQAPFVNWRNNLLRSNDGAPPMTRNASTPITQDARQAYRDTAIANGVPPHQYDVTQMLSRMLNDPGGHRDTLGPLAPPERPAPAPLPPIENPKGVTDLSTVFNRLPSLTDPQGMQNLRGSVNAGLGVTAGEPRINDIFASRINDLLDKTLLKREESALGPINYADTLRKDVDPQALSQSVGPQGAQTLQDVATLSRAFHRPTVSGGGTRSIMDVVNNTRRAATPLAAGALSLLLGHDPGAAAGIGATALGVSEALNRLGPIDRMRTAMLNSPSAGAAMAGRPVPYTGIDINDIRSTLKALEASTPYGPPQAQAQ